MLKMAPYAQRNVIIYVWQVFVGFICPVKFSWLVRFKSAVFTLLCLAFFSIHTLVQVPIFISCSVPVFLLTLLKRGSVWPIAPSPLIANKIRIIPVNGLSYSLLVVTRLTTVFLLSLPGTASKKYVLTNYADFPYIHSFKTKTRLAAQLAVKLLNGFWSQVDNGLIITRC